MTLAIHDAVALLREARVSVFHDHEYARIFGTEIEPAVAAVPKLADLLARIDAAVVQYEADMVQHRKDFVRDVKDLDRHLAAARAWKGDK